MNDKTPNPERSDRFHQSIAGFITSRREAKLKGQTPSSDSAARFEYSTWLADAARRVAQIQAVTHVLKATHPDARGSSFHVNPASLPRRVEVGSHALRGDFAEDVVGNAAALDVFKFLKIEVEGKRLLDWMRAGDRDLRQALHEDAATADAWMAAFSGLLRDEPRPTSHPLAKQVYWCIGNDPADHGQYHLLQPMFSSSLAHAVHAEIVDARFSESSKAAWQARRERQAHDGVHRDYPHLAVRKLGGTKPQNISQLNSERGGVNYLLASLPPRWRQNQTPKLLNLGTALDRFLYFGDVKDLIDRLCRFLASDPARTDETRKTRKTLEQALGEQLAIFAADVHARMEPGWTRDAACRLPLSEQLWLDPERVLLPFRDGHREEDEAFSTAHAFGGWPDEVAGRFANWVNARLRDAGLTAVGDAEYAHWARQAIVEAQWPQANLHLTGRTSS